MSITHRTKHPLYSTYKSMKVRCFDTNHPSYKNYGNRGITICDRWLGKDGFDNFVSDMGKRPEGKTLDRKDNNGDYSPLNCKWSTNEEQLSNRRNLPNKTGYPGAVLKQGKFEARAGTGGKIYLGRFVQPYEASLAYLVAKVFI